MNEKKKKKRKGVMLPGTNFFLDILKFRMQLWRPIADIAL